MILIGLGANLPSRFGAPAQTLDAAMAAIAARGVRVAARSRVWQSAPVPMSDYPWYCNAVAAVETALAPDALLRLLLDIESDFGRIRTIRNAPRVIDLDLLTYNDVVIDTPDLTLPHPRMMERAFVLNPIGDIDPGFLAGVTIPADQPCVPRPRGPALMGIVNVTPDSFSDGGDFMDPARAIEHGARLLDDGADILDVGGESTRPGADPIDAAQEIKRILPVIRGLADMAARRGARVSVDTYRPETMRAALDGGAHMINDVRALEHHPDCAAIAADAGVPVIIMHWGGHNNAPLDHSPSPNPLPKGEGLHHSPLSLRERAGVREDPFGYLQRRISELTNKGISRDNLIADPGIGFGKDAAANLAVLRDLARYRDLGVPLMVGASRKRFIAAFDRPGDARDRVGGSVAVALHAAASGVQYLRVHDVAATRQALQVDWCVRHGTLV